MAGIQHIFHVLPQRDITLYAHFTVITCRLISTYEHIQPWMIFLTQLQFITIIRYHLLIYKHLVYIPHHICTSSLIIILGFSKVSTMQSGTNYIKNYTTIYLSGTYNHWNVCEMFISCHII